MRIPLWILWGTLAVAGRGKEDVDARDAALAASEKQACAPGSVEGFQLHTGHGEGATEQEAVEAARRDARKRAVQTVCAGKSEARCAVIRRHVEQWKQPFYNPTRGRACAHVGVNRAWLDDDRGDAARLSEDLRGLAGQVATHAGGTPVAIDPITWGATGCNAGDVGGALAAELRNGLAGVGAFRLAAADSAGAMTLQTTLEARGTSLILASTLVDAGGGGVGRPLEGSTFAADLFGAPDAAECRADDTLGIERGRRRGADGLVAWIALGGGGVYCEGDRVEPVVHVSRPSRVQVYSVQQSGRALLVWPHSGHDGAVQRQQRLGSMDLHVDPDGADERLLAVAIPPDATFDRTAGWEGVCLLPDPLSESGYPASAAVGSVSYLVLPYDADTCLVRDTRARGPATMPALPDCPAFWDPRTPPPQ